MFERYHPEEWAYKRYLNSPIFRQLARGLGDDYLSFLQAAEQELIGTPFPPTGKVVFDAFEAWERGLVDTDDVPTRQPARIPSAVPEPIRQFEYKIRDEFWQEYFKAHTEELSGVAVIRMNTSMGAIELELNWDKAPWIVFHFLALAQHGVYNNTLLTPNCTVSVRMEGGYSTPSSFYSWKWNDIGSRLSLMSNPYFSESYDEIFHRKLEQWEKDHKIPPRRRFGKEVPTHWLNMLGGLGLLDSFSALALEHGVPILKMPFPGLGQVVKGGIWKPGPELIEQEVPEPLFVGPRHKDDGKRGEICWPKLTPRHGPLPNGPELPINREFYILCKDENELDRDETECLWGLDGTPTPLSSGSISFGRVISGMDVVDAISRVSSHVVRVSGPVEVSDLVISADVPFLMPVENVVLKDIEYLSGTPLTRAYKLASLPEAKRTELQNSIDRLSDVLPGTPVSEVMSDELSDELSQKIDRLVTEIMEKP